MTVSSESLPKNDPRIFRDLLGVVMRRAQALALQPAHIATPPDGTTSVIGRAPERLALRAQTGERRPFAGNAQPLEPNGQYMHADRVRSETGEEALVDYIIIGEGMPSASFGGEARSGVLAQVHLTPLVSKSKYEAVELRETGRNSPTNASLPEHGIAGGELLCLSFMAGGVVLAQVAGNHIVGDGTRIDGPPDSFLEYDPFWLAEKDTTTGPTPRPLADQELVIVKQDLVDGFYPIA